MGIEHQFFIWEERNSTDQQTNLSKNVEKDNCGIITETKKELTKPDVIDTKNVSGIYKIVNKINGKYYVGSSKNILHYNNGRFITHKRALRKNKHFNDYLQRAWNKYGEHNFDFLIIENVNPNNLELKSAEQKYLDIAKTERDKCYNASLFSDRVEMTELTKKKIREKSLLSTPGRFAGNKHLFYDHNIYRFKNIVTNEIFDGTRYDFSKIYDMDPRGIHKLLKHFAKSYNNWILDSVIKENVNRIFTHRDTVKKQISNNLKGRFVGELSSSYDTTIYKFQNRTTLEIFEGTTQNFNIKYNFNKSSGKIKDVAKGLLISYKNWILYDGKPIDQKNLFNRPVYEFKNDKTGELYRGTMRNFYKEHSFPSSKVYKLVKGIKKTYKGWKLVDSPDLNQILYSM